MLSIILFIRQVYCTYLFIYDAITVGSKCFELSQKQAYSALRDMQLKFAVGKKWPIQAF